MVENGAVKTGNKRFVYGLIGAFVAGAIVSNAPWVRTNFSRIPTLTSSIFNGERKALAEKAAILKQRKTAVNYSNLDALWVKFDADFSTKNYGAASTTLTNITGKLTAITKTETSASNAVKAFAAGKKEDGQKILGQNKEDEGFESTFIVMANADKVLGPVVKSAEQIVEGISVLITGSADGETALSGKELKAKAKELEAIYAENGTKPGFSSMINLLRKYEAAQIDMISGYLKIAGNKASNKGFLSYIAAERANAARALRPAAAGFAENRDGSCTVTVGVKDGKVEFVVIKGEGVSESASDTLKARYDKSLKTALSIPVGIFEFSFAGDGGGDF